MYICTYICLYYIKESLRTYSTGTVSVLSQASYSLRKRQDSNINIPNDVIELCQRTYCSAFIFSFALYDQLSGHFVPIPLILVRKKKCFLTFPGPPSKTAVSKVTSDFLISRAKAAFYFLPPCHITDYP